MLEFLRKHTGMAMQLVLHPEAELSDLPLKSYYRFALPEFAADGALLSLQSPTGCRMTDCGAQSSSEHPPVACVASTAMLTAQQLGPACKTRHRVAGAARGILRIIAWASGADAEHGRS